MTAPAFKGTLLLLQNRTRRDPDSYREEFRSQLEHLNALTQSTSTDASQRSNPQFLAVLSYICHVSHCYPSECAHVADVLIQLLRTGKTSMLPDTRLALVKNLMLLRSKDLVRADATLPVFFELLQIRDKTLRKVILSHIVGDVRKANLPTSKNGAATNKKVQSFLFHVMEEDDPVQARCALMVMIDLYRRMVWCDERTVQVMTRACFSRHTAILRTALRFFLMQMPKISSVDDDSDHEEEPDPGRTISKMKQKLKIVKKTKYRERVLGRRVKSTMKKYNKELKAEEAFAKQHVDPIRLLRDPHQFAEQLLQALHKTTERFEVRILLLNVLARVISEHEVVLVPLYGFLERYMEPSQLHATQLLALAAMCVHRMVPPDALEPLVRSIANHFVSDRSSPDAITIGINTIREICKRQPLAMSASLLGDLVEYRTQRGDRGVIMAARSLIQLYREVQPELLPVKLRAGRATAPEHQLRYGAPAPLSDIPGLELLIAPGDDTVANGSRGSDDVSSSASEIHISDSESDGSWEVVSDSDEMDSLLNDDEAFVDVSEAENDDDDTCPQLVPVAQDESTTTKKSARRTANEPVAADNEEDEVWLDDEEEDDSDDEVNGGVTKPSARKKARHDTVDAADSQESSSDDGSAFDDDEEDDEDDEDDEDEEDEDEEGEWVPVSDPSDSSASASDEETNELTAPSRRKTDEGLSAAATTTTLSAALAAASSSGNPGGDDSWFVDVDKSRADGKARSSSSTTSRSVAAASGATNATTVSVAATRFLTDEDFEKIRKLREQHGDHRSLRGKNKDQLAREERRKKLIHGVSADLQAHDIEQFTERKRASDKDEKIARAQDLRAASSKFEVRKKKKSKLHSTHGEHAKRGKLFQMTKRSQRVADKLKRSVEDRNDRKKDMKKKDVKFRIKRGWKA